MVVIVILTNLLIDILYTVLERAGGTEMSGFLRWLRTHPPAALSLLFLVTLFVLAVTAPVIAPYSPTKQDVNNTLAEASWQHLLGTDDLGRDVFSRLIYGAPITLYASSSPSSSVAGYAGRPASGLSGRTVR